MTMSTTYGVTAATTTSLNIRLGGDPKHVLQNVVKLPHANPLHVLQVEALVRQHRPLHLVQHTTSLLPLPTGPLLSLNLLKLLRPHEHSRDREVLLWLCHH
jgi:hypothetical protein